MGRMIDPKSMFSYISIKQIVEICGVDVTTARRWKRGAICPPQHVVNYLHAKYTGDLGFIDPAWRGWVLRDGHLISPEDWQMSMSDVLASRLHEAQLAAWRHEVAKMRIELAAAQMAQMDEQPAPDEWDLSILSA